MTIDNVTKGQAQMIEKGKADHSRSIADARAQVKLSQTITNSADDYKTGRRVARVTEISTTEEWRTACSAIEVFNLFNTPSFGSPNAAIGNAGFGGITTTGNNIPRQMQFAVKVLF